MLPAILHPMSNSKHLIDSGVWAGKSKSVQWQLYSSPQTPDISKCSAAFCVTLTPDNKIVLVRERRGWGMPGGHIEAGETIEQALTRECLEEAGFNVTYPVHFAHRKITATHPVPHPTPGAAYPFPISYIAYYYCVSDKPLLDHTEPDVQEVRAFTIEEIQSLDIADFSTILLGWNTYQKDMLQTQ